MKTPFMSYKDGFNFSFANDRLFCCRQKCLIQNAFILKKRQKSCMVRNMVNGKLLTKIIITEIEQAGN